AESEFSDRRPLDRRRPRVCRRSKPNVQSSRCENRQSAVGNETRYGRAGISGVLQHRRKTVHRRDDRTRRRQSVARAEYDYSGDQSAADGVCAVCVRAFGEKMKNEKFEIGRIRESQIRNLRLDRSPILYFGFWI